MKPRVFLDANVLVSVLNFEIDTYQSTSRILSLADLKKIDCYTSPLCIGITAYFVAKKSGEKNAKAKISSLSSRLKIIDVFAHAVSRCLKDRRILDIEDGIEYYSALDSKLQSIVTMDAGDFYFSAIPVYSPQQFLAHFLAGDF